MKIKSIQEELFVWICVGLLINWEKPFEYVNENNFDPYVAVDFALKPPVNTAKDGFCLLISLKRWSKLVKNESNSQLFWLGEW